MQHFIKQHSKASSTNDCLQFPSHSKHLVYNSYQLHVSKTNQNSSLECLPTVICINTHPKAPKKSAEGH